MGKTKANGQDEQDEQDEQEQLQINEQKQSQTIIFTTQEAEQQENTKSPLFVKPPAGAMANKRNFTIQQNRDLIQRMRQSFTPSYARKALPDAEVVQTAGKSDDKIKKAKNKIASARNSVADHQSYDLKLEANRQLTAVNPTLNDVIADESVDMTKEENVYRCAIMQSFMAEDEDPTDKFFLKNFLSVDADKRFCAFHKMMESIRSIEIPREEMTTEYVFSHIKELQNIKMRVEAFDNYRKRAVSGADELSRQDSSFFSSLSESELALLEDKIEMGRRLGNILQCALMQKGLRYVNDPDSPFNDPANGGIYSGLFQSKKLDYCRKDEAQKYSRLAAGQIEIEKAKLQEASEHSETVLNTLRNESALSQMVHERTANARIPESVTARVQNADKVAEIREIFQREETREYFKKAVDASNEDLATSKFTDASYRNSSARTKLGLRTGKGAFKEVMNLAFTGLNQSMQEYFASLRLDCEDILPLLQRVDRYGSGSAYFGCGTEEIAKGFLKVLREHILSPAGIELFRNMCEQMSGAVVFQKNGKADPAAIIQDMYTNFANVFLGAAFTEYGSCSYGRVATLSLNEMTKTAPFLLDGKVIPKEVPVDVSGILDSYRELTDEILSRF